VAGKFTYDGTQFWVSQNDDYAIQSANSAGKVLGTFTVKAPANDLAWFGGRLVLLSSKPAVIVEVDAAGAVVGAFQLPSEIVEPGAGSVIVGGLAADGETLWVGVEVLDTTVTLSKITVMMHDLGVQAR
jgi:hypothetical protein